jgi:hypothetical protein
MSDQQQSASYALLQAGELGGSNITENFIPINLRL